jgi:hypothetical protein
MKIIQLWTTETAWNRSALLISSEHASCALVGKRLWLPGMRAIIQEGTRKITFLNHR